MRIYKVRKVEINQQSASTTVIEFEFRSELRCYDLIKLAELKEWEIFVIEKEGSLNEEVINRSPRYKEFLLKEADDRAAWLKSQYEKAERINNLPKDFRSLIDFPEGVTFEYERSQAEFKPNTSSRVLWYLKGVIKINGVVRDFYSGNYVTRDGKIQVSKFAGDMACLFGGYAHQMSPEIIKRMVAEYKELKKSIETADKER